MNRIYVTAVVAIAAGSWAIVLVLNGFSVPTSFFKPFSIVVSTVLATIWAFDNWLWRVPALNVIVKRPNLMGTWKGSLQTDWVNQKTGIKPGPIDVYLVVRQTFSTIHIRILTPESQSFSLAATVVQEADEQFVLTWVYRNDPAHSVQERSRSHFGGGLLRVGGPPPTLMAGHYWTDRNTAGEMSFNLSSRECVNDYLTAKKIGQA